MVAFGEVTETVDRVLILASGPSASGLDLELVHMAHESGVYVLAVNRSMRWAPLSAVRGFFTLDPDRRVLPILQERRKRITYYAAVPDDYGTNAARIAYHRGVGILPWVTYLRRIRGQGPLGSRYKLSEDPGEIHTGNSAWGALGVAYHMGASRVTLVGVDATDEGYAYLEGDPRTGMGHLPELFLSACGQLQGRVVVVNGSRDSRVRCFMRVSPDQAVRWVMEGL